MLAAPIRFLRPFGVLFVVLLAACGSVVAPGDAGHEASTITDSSIARCAFGDGRYCPVGESCPAGDGCNQCYCNTDLSLDCTLLACADAGPPPCTQQSDCAGLGPTYACIFAPGCDAPHGTCGQRAPCTEGSAFCGCDGLIYRACEPTTPYSAADACPVPPSFDCDPAHVTCRSLPPTCPPGEVPSVAGNCWSGCVSFAGCAAIPCTSQNGNCPAQTFCDSDLMMCTME